MTNSQADLSTCLCEMLLERTAILRGLRFEIKADHVTRQ